MEYCLLIFLVSIMTTHVESAVEIDDIITEAIQKTYDEPLRKTCSRQDGKYTCIYTQNPNKSTQGNIRLRFIFAPFALVVSGRIQN